MDSDFKLNSGKEGFSFRNTKKSNDLGEGATTKLQDTTKCYTEPQTLVNTIMKFGSIKDGGFLHSLSVLSALQERYSSGQLVINHSQ